LLQIQEKLHAVKHEVYTVWNIAALLGPFVVWWGEDAALVSAVERCVFRLKHAKCRFHAKLVRCLEQHDVVTGSYDS
jgi:hypothetical protein